LAQEVEYHRGAIVGSKVFRVRIEDTVAITDKGHEELTKYPRTL